MDTKKPKGRLARLLNLSKGKSPRDRYLIISARVSNPKIKDQVEKDLAAGVKPTVLLNDALEQYYQETGE